MRYVEIIESALRAAVLNTLMRENASIDQLTVELKRRAKEIAAQLSTHLNSDEYQKAMNEQANIIDDLIDGMSKGFRLQEASGSSSQERRASFERDRSFDLVTFSLPNSRGNKSSSREKRFVSNYLSGLKSKNLLAYFGLKEPMTTPFLSVAFPLFKLCNNPDLGGETNALLHKAKLSTHVFFNTLVSENIGAVDNGFFKDSIFTVFIESMIEKDNYLNDRRLIELVTFSASNALWFLMDPVNEQGLKLSGSEKISLCKTFIDTLRQTVNELDIGALNKKGQDGVALKKIISQVISRMKLFKSAFFAEQKSALLIGDVSCNMKRSLGYVNQAVMALAFDGSALNVQNGSVMLPEIIKAIVQFVSKDKSLLKGFKELLHFNKEEEPVSNDEAITVMDVLIFFTHATPAKKQALFEALSVIPSQNRQGLYEQLFLLDEHFIKPVYLQNESKLNLSILDRSRHKIIAKESAKQLMPLLCLVIEMCDIELEPKLMHTQKATGLTITTHSSKEQLLKLKRATNADNCYYDWSLSGILNKRGGRTFLLQGLPIKLDSIFALLAFNDHLNEAIIEQPQLLVCPSFLNFINQSMAKIKYEYHELASIFNSTDQTVIKCIDNAVKLVVHQVSNITHTVNQLLSQDLAIISKNQAETLQVTLNELSGNYVGLFRSSMGIEPINIGNANVLHDIDLEESFINTPDGYVATSLLQVIERCYQSLSFFVPHGDKSIQLVKLGQLVKELACISSFDDAKHLAGDLAKIVMVSRPSCTLFKAEPGFSNSAQCLYREMKRLRFDDEFPLAKLLLGDSFDIHCATDDDVRVAMQEKFLGIDKRSQNEDEEPLERTPIV